MAASLSKRFFNQRQNFDKNDVSADILLGRQLERKNQGESKSHCSYIDIDIFPIHFSQKFWVDSDFDIETGPVESGLK